MVVRRSGVALAVVSVLAIASTVSAACPYPLGEFAANGDIVIWDWDGQVEDVERAIVEGTLIHGQKSFGQVVNVAGHLKLVYNAEVEWEEDGNPFETHSIFLKEYSNETGWDVPLQFMASEDPTVEIPVGRNVQPNAAAIGPDLWSLWEATGRVRANGSYILMRGHNDSGFGPTQVVSPDWKDAASKQVRIINFGSITYIAFVTNAFSSASDEFRLVGRTWDGRALGPLENISAGNDGWTEPVGALATDGTRIFAAFTSQNMSDLAGAGDWDVKVAVRSTAGTWTPEVALTDNFRALAAGPAVAWFQDRAYVAWTTDDARMDSRGDLDIVMQAFDPATGTAGPLLSVSTDEFQGTDVNPAIYAWDAAEGGDGKLHILWSSDSSPNSIPTSGVDNDIFYRTFDAGVFSAVSLVSDPLDNGFVEVLPGFFTIGGGLYAYFLSNICLPGCGHETDWREMTRLLSRPARPYDDVTAHYTLESAFPASNATSVAVRFVHADGSPANASDYFAVKPDGSVSPLVLNNGAGALAVAYNSSLNRQFSATYCGKDLPTVEDVVAPPAVPGKPSPVGDVVAPAFLAAALVGALAARRVRRT